MISILTFEEELSRAKELFEHGWYEYLDLSITFKEHTTNHFRYVSRKEKYGVYVIRRQVTKDLIFIGKSGTISQDGMFRSQDIPKRLKNIRTKQTPSNKWFAELLMKYGPLSIEYVFLPTTQSPALIEALLLQAYYNQYHCLPLENKSF